MKNFVHVALASMIATTGFAVSAEEVIISTNSVHVPQGFDANDHVEVILTGELPNTCYRRPYGDAKVQGDVIKIDIKATKITDPNVLCIQAIVPYMISVPVGSLAQGEYQIEVNPNTTDAKTGALRVETPSSESIDNFTYANVTSVTRLPNSNTLAIAGEHPSSCMSIESVEVIANSTRDTFSLLPIIKQTEPLCDRSMKPFVQYVELPDLGHKEIVVHVRKLDGNALNFLIAKQPESKSKPSKKK